MSSLLVFDPSGNHAEGNGTTGWAYFEDGQLKDFGDIKAKEWAFAESYWNEHLHLIQKLKAQDVVYETYKLQAGKAMQQSWSQLETPQLIGCIRLFCWTNEIHHDGQDPSVKPRFSDDVLVATGVAERKNGVMYIQGRRTNMHQRDAIRHGMYYLRYGGKKK